MTISSEFNSHYLLIRCLLVVVLIEYSNGGNGKYCEGVEDSRGFENVISLNVFIILSLIEQKTRHEFKKTEIKSIYKKSGKIFEKKK